MCSRRCRPIDVAHLRTSCDHRSAGQRIERRARAHWHASTLRVVLRSAVHAYSSLPRTYIQLAGARGEGARAHLAATRSGLKALSTSFRAIEMAKSTNNTTNKPIKIVLVFEKIYSLDFQGAQGG